MTGKHHFNVPAFDAKRDDLLAAGHTPVSPADLDRAFGYDPAHSPTDDGFVHSAIRRDLDAVLQCDGVVVLTGWEHSRGACAEVAVARWAGIPVFLPGQTIPGGTQK